MAKKQTPSDQTHTLSTRLTTEQKEFLDEAASAAGMSTAKFLRAAALQQARDALSAQPPNDQAIRELATLIHKRLTIVEATVRAESQFDEIGADSRTITVDDGVIGLDQMKSFGFDDDYRFEPKTINVHKISKRDTNELEAMLESAPITFARALLAELKQPTQERARFRPVPVKPGLQDLDDD